MKSGGAPAGRRVMPYARALALAAAVAAVVGAVWVARRGTPTLADRRLGRLVADSPFRNIGPGVGYVGSAACTRCHADVAESYRAHPMGRSVARIAADDDDEDLRAAPANAEFDAAGYHYAVERRAERLVHREQRLGDGEAVAAVEADVAYALGSGERGYSFLVERDGFVAQSPIAWYAQESRYDLAPGYDERNFHFERVILPGCLSCHVDGATPAGGAHNRYATPLDLRPIGCERCHGPGSLHVHGPGIGEGGLDATWPLLCGIRSASSATSRGQTVSSGPATRRGISARGSRSTSSSRSSSRPGRRAAPGPSARSSRCTPAAATPQAAAPSAAPHATTRTAARGGPSGPSTTARAASRATTPRPAASPSPTAAPARPTTVAPYATCPGAGPKTSLIRR
jgi:Cytochrome c554 and c-prime